MKLDVLYEYWAVINIVIDQLELSAGAVISDLDLVLNLVIKTTIGTLLSTKFVKRNLAEVCRHIDQMFDATYDPCKL